MSPTKFLTITATAAVMVATPAWALPGGVPSTHASANANGHGGNSDAQTSPSTPGPNASLPAKAHACGLFCQEESKKDGAGQKGRPFGQSVPRAANLATGRPESPAKG